MVKTSLRLQSLTRERRPATFFPPLSKPATLVTNPERPQPPSPSSFIHSGSTRFPPSWRVQSQPQNHHPPSHAPWALLPAPKGLPPGPSGAGPVGVSHAELPAGARTLRLWPRPPGPTTPPPPRPRPARPSQQRSKAPAPSLSLSQPYPAPGGYKPHTAFRTLSLHRPQNHRPRPQSPTLPHIGPAHTELFHLPSRAPHSRSHTRPTRPQGPDLHLLAS